MADLNINGVTYSGVEAIVVNGNIYYLDAIKYTPQTLTNAQKAQARGNIGINNIVLAGTDENGVEHTWTIYGE